MWTADAFANIFLHAYKVMTSIYIWCETLRQQDMRPIFRIRGLTCAIFDDVETGKCVFTSADIVPLVELFHSSLSAFPHLLAAEIRSSKTMRDEISTLR